MIKYYTIPGYGDSDENHWQSYFDRELDNCERIVQDNYARPIMEKWVSCIEETLEGKDLSESILITHSVGGMAFLHWAKIYGKIIKGALIVAPPDVDHPYQNFGLESFTPIPKDKLPFPTIVVASSNDPWMPVAQVENFVQLWGSELVVLDNAGHINAASGYSTWPEGLDILKRLV